MHTFLKITIVLCAAGGGMKALNSAYTTGALTRWLTQAPERPKKVEAYTSEDAQRDTARTKRLQKEACGNPSLAHLANCERVEFAPAN